MEVVILVLLGLCFGSFVNALVWRVHENEKKSAKNKLSVLKGRSMCPNCKYELGILDLIPIFSWVMLTGKCRNCNKPISWQYPVVEALTAVLFVASYINWPYELSSTGYLLLASWLVCLIFFVALAVYDIKWMLLPNKLVYILIGTSLVNAITLGIQKNDLKGVLISSLLGVLFSAGFFYVLFQVSSGKWIGGGDVKLAIALGILVGGPIRSVLMLFIASLAGSLVSLILVVAHKTKIKSRVPFGPFLIIATYIVYIWGNQIINWYENLFLGV